MIAINPASVESHEKYVQKFNFNFPLVADTDKKICKLYDVLEDEKVIRTVYIVAPDGKIIYTRKGMPDNTELLNVIKEDRKNR